MMKAYFLLSNLLDPAKDKMTGGVISNLLMIEKISGYMSVVLLPIMYEATPSSLAQKETVSIVPPSYLGTSYMKYAVERYVFYQRRVEKAIKRYGPGILIATRATIPIAYRLSVINQMPFIIITRAFENLEQIGLRKPLDKISIFRRAEGILNKRQLISAYRSADLIITNSKFMKEEHVRLFKTNVPFYISYPLIDLPMSSPVVNKIKTIGFVSKGKRKGGELIHSVAARMPDKNFIVYGEPIDKKLGDLPNLRYAGYTNDRVHMYKSVDLFLVPSAWDEPYGRVASEAIWSGLPVLISKRGGLPEAAPEELFWVVGDTAEIWEDKIRNLSFNKYKPTLEGAIRSAQIKLSSQPDDLPGVLYSFFMKK